MPIWKLYPVANPEDPRWLDHQIWEEVLVRAPTSGMARMLAGQIEQDPHRPLIGNESPSYKSGLDDDKLYALVLAENDGIEAPGEAPGEAPRVLRAVKRGAASPPEVAREAPGESAAQR